MAKTKSSVERDLRKIVEGEGARFVALQSTRKHSRLIYEIAGRTLNAVVSKTPSDVRALRNIRTQIRHQITAVAR